ncbi:hypothetical protein [Catenovulum adriaticum]|uniref:Heme biosynthesis protein HemY n=1 Tax=Catenovulum adriaticum TaxID=2984846 RepID=A0ABY7AP25_9ALTE|nr:hypothetical protein [Catenovulum sp. TS8]WAJ71317.1 hypothetical protein OLW01_05835 [Catenovulum sp. TS8]
MHFFKQILIGCLAACMIIAIAAGIYWLFHAGERYLDASYSTNPITSPILWLVIIIAALIALVTRFWRVYQEKRFIKRFHQYKKMQNKAARNKVSHNKTQ